MYETNEMMEVNSYFTKLINEKLKKLTLNVIASSKLVKALTREKISYLSFHLILVQITIEF